MKVLNCFKECTYNIGFIKKKIENVMLEGICEGDIVWLKHNYKDRFFADPFLIKEDDNFFYILCEEFVFDERLGKIALLTVDRKNYELIKKELLIKESYHLSFPFCELSGEWILPEACWSGSAYAYRFDQQKMTIKEKVKVADEGLVDNVLYREKDGTVWLYAGITNCANGELYVYRLDKTNKFKKVQSRPVEKGNDKSRSAGAFFICSSKLYRPVQDCTVRYGQCTKIMEVLSLGGTGYKVREYCTLNSFANPTYNDTMHTFNVYNGVILVDGSKDVFRLRKNFFQKVFNKMKGKITSRFYGVML